MIVRKFSDIQTIQRNKVEEKKIINLLYLLEEQIRVESVPHVLKHHTFICARRALAESVTLSGLTENFPWIFAIYHRYLAFLKFKDSVAYHFKMSGCRSCCFCNSLNRCLSFKFLLYLIIVTKAFIKYYERISSEATQSYICFKFSIACKINLGLVKNNRNPGGRGVFGLGNPGGRGGQLIQEIWVGRGVKKPCHPSGVGGVWIFSGITHYFVMAEITLLISEICKL